MEANKYARMAKIITPRVGMIYPRSKKGVYSFLVQLIAVLTIGKGHVSTMINAKRKILLLVKVIQLIMNLTKMKKVRAVDLKRTWIPPNVGAGIPPEKKENGKR